MPFPAPVIRADMCCIRYKCTAHIDLLIDCQSLPVKSPRQHSMRGIALSFQPHDKSANKLHSCILNLVHRSASALAAAKQPGYQHELHHEVRSPRLYITNGPLHCQAAPQCAPQCMLHLRPHRGTVSPDTALVGFDDHLEDCRWHVGLPMWSPRPAPSSRPRQQYDSTSP